MTPEAVRPWLQNPLFHQIPVPIAVINRDFHIVEANPCFTDTYGDWQDQPCYRVYKDRSDHCQQCGAVLAFADGKPRVHEEQGRDRHGNPIYYLVHLVPLPDPKGHIDYVVEMSIDVTERKQLEEDYHFLFDQVPCFISVLDQDFRIIRANETFRRTFGDQPGEYCFRVYKQRSEPCLNCPTREVFQDGQVHTASQVGRDREGREIRYIVTASPLRYSGGQVTQVIEMATDITQTHLLEAQLREILLFQQRMIASSMDSIVATDAAGRAFVFNQAAQELFGYSAAEALRHAQAEKLYPSEFLETIAAEELGEVWPETTVRDRAGNPIPVRFSGVVLRDQDRFLGAGAFLQDLRPLKQLQAEKLEAERLAAVGQTVAGLAHGVKNLLMGLEGGMYVVRSGITRDNQDRIQRGWAMLEDNIARISAFVKDFLSFARGRQPQVARVDPNRIAQEVVDLFRDTAAQSGITITAELQEGISPAFLDAEGIHTCLANLISNALDACEMSDADRCQVRVQTQEANQTLIYQVADDGCGMDYEVKQKVFTSFFSTKGSDKGTGLGLLVTRKIVQEHGGKITFESAEGEGSLFRMEFPREHLPTPTEEKEE